MPALIASSAFGERLDSAAVARALARGMQAGGLAAPGLLELHSDRPSAAELRELLAHEHFDARLHTACALVLAVSELCERTLAGSAAFELASRARQAGVPAYAIASHCALASFDVRMLDLQLVLQARSARALAGAGRRVAAVMLSAG